MVRAEAVKATVEVAEKLSVVEARGLAAEVKATVEVAEKLSVVEARGLVAVDCRRCQEGNPDRSLTDSRCRTRRPRTYRRKRCKKSRSSRCREAYGRVVLHYQ